MSTALKFAVAVLPLTIAPAFADPTPMEQLGKALFFDTALSAPPGQSAVDCRGP